MKAAIFRGPLELTVGETPTPKTEDGSALVRIAYAAICGSDVRTYRHGRAQVKPPIILGHEMSGKVISAPDPSLVGRNVAVLPNYACGVCEPCRRGRENLCQNLKVFGLSVNGGMAEYLLVPPDAWRAGILFPLPEDTDLAAVTLGEPLSCVLNAHELVRTGLGDGVLVHGAGPIGIMHAVVARRLGASWVAISEPTPFRREHAANIADVDVLDVGEVAEYIASHSGGWGADVQIVATSSPNALVSSLQYAAPGGRISIFGGFTKEAAEIALDANAIHYRELMVVGATGGTRNQMKKALELIVSGDMPAAALISHHIRLEEVVSGIVRVESGEAMRVVIDLGGR